MKKIFEKKKKTRPAQAGFRDFDAFLRETSDPAAPPAVPAVGIVAKDELPGLLQVRTIRVRPDDPVIIFDAITGNEEKAGIRLRDARAVLLSGAECRETTYDRMAGWIRQNDTGHLLCGSVTGDAQILHTICEVLKVLLSRNEIPEKTFRLFDRYVWIGIEYRNGHFYDRKTRKEISPEDALARETDVRLKSIRANMDRAGAPEEEIGRTLEKAREDIRAYYRSLAEDPVGPGSDLAYRTDSGAEYHLSWTGIMRYYPNDASASGYGSDDWMYLCRMDDRYWILYLQYSGEAVWRCLPISDPDAERIRQTSGEALKAVYCANWDQDRLILHLHPEDLRLIEKIVFPDYHREGLLTSRDLYGI